MGDFCNFYLFLTFYFNLAMYVSVSSILLFFLLIWDGDSLTLYLISSFSVASSGTITLFSVNVISSGCSLDNPFAYLLIDFNYWLPFHLFLGASTYFISDSSINSCSSALRSYGCYFLYVVGLSYN